jgi:hypothetical protein
VKPFSADTPVIFSEVAFSRKSLEDLGRMGTVSFYNVSIMGFSWLVSNCFILIPINISLDFARTTRPPMGNHLLPPFSKIQKEVHTVGVFLMASQTLSHYETTVMPGGFCRHLPFLFRFSTRVETVAFQYDRSNASSRPARSRRWCPTSAGTLARGYGGFHQ